MDYGRTLINTYEVGDDGSNFAYKGIAVRLDEGPGGVSRGRHWMIFDHDTMRMAATWTGDKFIDWKGIHFNGQHNIHPRIVGDVQAENKTGPGWAEPETGSWDDPRLVGRDDRLYGPLPREWAHYKGMYYHGNQTVISYHVGTTPILERPRLLTESPQPVYAREIQFGPRDQPLTLQVAQLGDSVNRLSKLTSNSVLLGPEPAQAASRNTELLRFDGASHAQVESADDFRHDDEEFYDHGTAENDQGWQPVRQNGWGCQLGTRRQSIVRSRWSTRLRHRMGR